MSTTRVTYTISIPFHRLHTCLVRPASYWRLQHAPMARIWNRTAVLFMLFVLFLQVVVFLVLQHQYNRIKELRTQLQQELSPGVLLQISPTNYLPQKVGDNADNIKEQTSRSFHSLAVTPGNVREHIAVTPNNVREYLPQLFHSTAVPPNNADHLPAISCPKLFAGDTEDIKLVKKYRSGRESSISNGFYLETTRDCPAFRRIRGYIESSVDAEEEDFPVAFSILLFRDVERTERLLRAIYRPWNHYCLHIDKKAGREVYEVSCSWPRARMIKIRKMDGLMQKRRDPRSPLLTHWSYVSFAFSQRNVVM